MSLYLLLHVRMCVDRKMVDLAQAITTSQCSMRRLNRHLKHLITLCLNKSTYSSAWFHINL